MKERTTLSENWLKRYGNSPKNVTISSIILENDVITSGNLKKRGCLIYYINKEYIHGKSSQKTSLLKICTTDVLIRRTN